MDATVQVRDRGVLTLPAELREKYGIRSGDTLKDLHRSTDDPHCCTGDVQRDGERCGACRWFRAPNKSKVRCDFSKLERAIQKV